MKKFRKQDSEKYFEEKKPVRLVDTQEYMEMIRALLELSLIHISEPRDRG